MQYSTSAYFATFTLRFNPQLGVSKRHLQLFFKRLRRRVKKRVSYYAVAEYGARTMRPHYHAIIFNADESSILRSWKLGHVHLGTVSDASIGYVANYSLKGSRYPVGKRRPFSVMSRRPAIGSKYLETHKEWHRVGRPFQGLEPDVSGFRAFTQVNGRKGHLPRFYRDRFFSQAERKAMLPELLKDMDSQFEKELERLKTLHPSPFNYMIERDRFHHDFLKQKFLKNETI